MEGEDREQPTRVPEEQSVDKMYIFSRNNFEIGRSDSWSNKIAPQLALDVWRIDSLRSANSQVHPYKDSAQESKLQTFDLSIRNRDSFQATEKPGICEDIAENSLEFCVPFRGEREVSDLLDFTKPTGLLFPQLTKVLSYENLIHANHTQSPQKHSLAKRSPTKSTKYKTKKSKEETPEIEVKGKYDEKVILKANKFFCRCEKTKCSQLYCLCFKNGLGCSDRCSCVRCDNKNPTEERVGLRRVILKKRREFEKKKSGHDGCNCKKSFCLTKYCKCFQSGVGCGNSCSCFSCRNKH